ncbi:SCO7613 C-terminal domain-containing membrane protein [Pseudolysinimonas sp.]|uniref:SCO7613 C-terminal domain-containing membrane protein n=1 Tax=Pseudolysinimonas sp. TaxID=2680009 RepID=UPI003F80300E
MPAGWSSRAADFVASTTVCPRCDTALGPGPLCPRCGARLDGPEAVAVREASIRAATALRERQRLIDLLPTGAPVPRAASPSGTPVAAATPASGATAPARPRSQVSVSSVLAVVGAALVAIAAIVFTFVNPDVDQTARSVVIGVLTVVFLGVAWLLQHRGLRLSAEAVGALGMVLVVLDVWAAVQRTPLDLSGWVPAAVGTLLASAVMLAAAVRVRLRVWLWSGLAGAVVVPAMFGYAVAPVTPWAFHAGHVGVVVAAWGAHLLLRRLEARFASPLRADHLTATVLALLAAAETTVTLPLIPAPDAFLILAGRTDGTLVRLALTGAALVALAAAAVLHARVRFATPWSVLAGVWAALAVAQVALVPLPAGADPTVRPIAFLALAGAVVVLLLVATPTPRGVSRPVLLIGGLTTAGVLVMPAVLTGIAQLASTGLALPPVPALASVGGLVGAALAAAGAGSIAGRRGGGTTPRRAGRVTGLWLAVLALVGLALWPGWSRTTVAVVAVVVAAALGLAVRLLPALRSAAAAIRLPLVLGGHLLVVLAVAVSWQRDPFTVPVGAAAVAALVPLSLVVPAAVRPFSLGAGYGYALIVLATGLARAGVEPIPVIALTASAAALGGIAATLVTRLRAPLWYAALAVTALPFLIGVASVLVERSGWTALSTGLILLLALTLLVTRRAGLTLVVRTLAAALLVPALAVVVVCLGAQLLVTSGAPVTLPIIAVIVAGALSAGGAIGTGLVRRGLPDREATAARLAIEGSALLTGAIAVLLALVRAAAGLPTTLVVLLILGAGAAAAAVFAGRRAGWWVAGVCWSGALWCALRLSDVQVVEPYVLPPALAIAVVGVVLSARGGAGLPLVVTGLVGAALPSLVLLAVTGTGVADPATGIPWRTVGLLLGALVLLALSWAAAGRIDRVGGLARLHRPVLLVSIGAAAAGPIQALRWGAGADPLGLVSSALVLPCLGIALVAALIAAGAGRRLVASGGASFALGAPLSRWVLVPALAFLAIGPDAAIRDAWTPIWTFVGLLVVLLAGVVLIADRARRGPTLLPPVWVAWLAAWIVAVVGWSARELRVEVYGIPLGVALLVAGVIAMRSVAADGRSEARPDVRPGPTSWPIGFTGSWALLAPGIVVVLLPSVLSTGTDPQTWRAILVIALALIAILVGSLFKLGAPFVLGIAVLPIENVLVFAVQLGRGIAATPWWITLASAGAVLLVIAVTWERRTGRDRGVTARLRDLR